MSRIGWIQAALILGTSIPVGIAVTLLKISPLWVMVPALPFGWLSERLAKRISSRLFSLAPVIMAALVATFEPADDPTEWQRFANVAVATERAVDDQIARGWHGSKWELVSATLTAIRFESGNIDLAVHDGRNTRNGFCLGQIHPTNGFWKDYSPSLQELTGTDVEATYRCLRTVTRTLASGRSYCHKRHYRTNWRTAMWSLYGTGHKCWISPTAARRSKFQRGLESKRFEADARMVELVEAARSGA